MTDTSRATRLSSQRYLELLAADGGRLATVSQGRLADPVPTCPGWSVADLVRHTGSVYHHKIACVRLGRRPVEGEWQTDAAEGRDLLSWYGHALTSLLDLLGSRGAQDPAFTWYPPEQDVGFWQRRMAQEAAVHRVDAEAAAGVVTAVDDDLATDGVDEVLDLFLRYALGDDPDEDVTGHDGLTALVRTGPYAWHVGVRAGDPAGQVVLRREGAPAQVTVAGEPSELLLWLWGRRPDTAVTVQGSAPAAAGLRALLERGTQ